MIHKIIFLISWEGWGNKNKMQMEVPKSCIYFHF